MSNGLRRKSPPKDDPTEKTVSLILKEENAVLLHHACVHAPLQGLRLADLARIDTLKKLLVAAKGEGGHTVEVPSNLVSLLTQLWEAIDIGTLHRIDELAGMIQSTQEAIDKLKT